MPTFNQKPRKFLAVAFDLDGTMVNSEDIYDQVLEQFLAARGFEFTLEIKRAMMGLRAADAFAALQQQVPIRETSDQVSAEVHQLLAQAMPASLQVMPGVPELLADVDALELPRAVVTSSPQSFAQATLAIAKLDRGFDFVLTGDDIQTGKPDPAIYLKAAELFGIETRQMLVLEDSLNGTLAAARSGAFTIAVPGKHSTGQDFSHANLIAENLLDPRIRQLLTD